MVEVIPVQTPSSQPQTISVLHQSSALLFAGIDPSAEFGQEVSNGAATTAARSDHIHALPAHDAQAHSGIRLSDLERPDGSISMGSQLLRDLADAVSGQDAVTKSQLDAVASIAGTAVQPGDLSTVATTGAYSDLLGKPVLGTSSARDVGTTAGTVAAGDDSRLSDSRTPVSHASTHATGGADPVTPADIGAATSSQGALADTAVQPEDLGTAAYTATTDYAASDDARLTDARTPTSHASTHAAGGTDPLTPADIGAATSAQGSLADTAVQPGDLSTVATTGEYTDLVNPPTLGDSASLDVGTTAGTVAAGDDARLSDERTPLDNSVTLAKLADNAAVVLSNEPPASPNVGTLWVDADQTTDTLVIPVPTESIADGAITQAKFATGLAPVLIGTGSPLGVITPDYPGQVYSDSEVTCGAALWRATGATNSDWTVSDGDTGWRDVTGDLINGWTGIDVLIRRVGNIVHFYAWRIYATDATQQRFLLPAAGFRWSQFGHAANEGYPTGSESASITKVLLGNDYRLGASAITSQLALRVMWNTDQAWPTVLPGVAV